jgi:hypothetical protein
MRTKEGREDVWHRSQIIAINVLVRSCVFSNFAVVFNFNVFPFPPSKAHNF